MKGLKIFKAVLKYKSTIGLGDMLTKDKNCKYNQAIIDEMDSRKDSPYVSNKIFNKEQDV